MSIEYETEQQLCDQAHHAHALEATIEELTSQNKELIQEADDLDQGYDILRKKYDDLKATYDQLKADHMSLKVSYDQIKREYENQVKHHDEEAMEHLRRNNKLIEDARKIESDRYFKLLGEMDRVKAESADINRKLKDENEVYSRIWALQGELMTLVKPEKYGYRENSPMYKKMKALVALNETCDLEALERISKLLL